MDTLIQDLRIVGRGLARAPGFTAIVILTLALGIGANAAIFSVVSAVLLRPLPYRYADRTMVLWNSPDGQTQNAISPPEYFDFKEQLRTFDAVVALRGQVTTILGDGGDPERVSTYIASPGLFDVLGVAPAIGRSFRADDGVEGNEKVIVLSHSLWLRRFGGDRAVLGQRVTVAGIVRTIVGVMPPDVRFPDAPLGFLRERADLWVPTSWEATRSDSRGDQYTAVIARLRDGTSPAQGRADLGTVAERWRAAFPDRYAPPAVQSWTLLAVPLRDQMVGSVRPALFVLTGAVGLVLLIACVNAANLLLARGTLRRREMAVRLALGANRSRLLRQLLTESTLLALAGGALGVLLAWIGVPLLIQLDGGHIPRLDGTRLNPAVLAFSVGMSVLTGILIGLVPALQQSRTELRAALGEGTRGAGDGQARRRLRSVLVGAQVAMALVILIGAGLLVRSFLALQQVDPGFVSERVLSMHIAIPRAKYDSSAKVVAFFEQIRSALAELPGVASAGAAFPLPMSGEGWSGSLKIEGEPERPLPHAEYAVASPDYFRTMGIPLLAGREFTTADRRGAPAVVIVDERLARRHWPNQSALGKRVDVAGDWAPVVGVVGHVHNSGPHEAGEPQVYFSAAQFAQSFMAVVVRGTGDPRALTTAVRQVVRDRDRDLATTAVSTMDELVSNAVSRQRFNTLMLTVFALTALALASVGLYGVMSYLVSQRTREIGIRMALGGQPADVRRMVVRESLVISVSGLVVGAAASLALSHLLSQLLFGIKATDFITYASISVLLLAVAGVASYGPARRATRIDPTIALKE